MESISILRMAYFDSKIKFKLQQEGNECGPVMGNVTAMGSIALLFCFPFNRFEGEALFGCKKYLN